MSADTADLEMQDAERRLLSKLAAAQGKDQQIVYINRPAENSKRLNSIILGIASFTAGALLSLIIWQLNRLTDKVDDVNGRLIRVETTIGAKP